MVKPNMSVSSMRDWMDSEEYKDYRSYRDSQKYRGYTKSVCERAIRVIDGSASDEEVETVRNYIKRAKKQSAGSKRFGSGSSSVSARTAALRNWGYDPSGRYS